MNKFLLMMILTFVIFGTYLINQNDLSSMIKQEIITEPIRNKEIKNDEKVLKIIYPFQESVFDTRNRYQWEVLEAAMEETKEEGQYELIPSKVKMSEAREIVEVSKKNGLLTVLRQANLKGLEDSMLPIKIPLLKGTLGWRVFLIRKETQKLLDKEVTSLEKLKTIRHGTGTSWADNPILRGNGFAVTEGSNYDGLFSMLESGRFQVLPRGINECLKELNERKKNSPDIVLEKKIILRYKLFDFFWVNKKNVKLANRIERGLLKIRENGIMDNIFNKYFENDMLPLGLYGRTIYDISSEKFTFPIKNPPEEYLMESYLRKKQRCWMLDCKSVCKQCPEKCWQLACKKLCVSCRNYGKLNKAK
ncbi:MAG: hypothetical protein COA79_07780 [Planctomycetota bacterium]|nr:MAG: hypothetical protein COA79_07780 [Planctomycetota bacterium]